VLHVPDATVKGFPHWSVTPPVLYRVELFHSHASNLKWGVDVQVLVEGRYPPASLASLIVKLNRRPVFMFHDSCRCTVVDNHPHLFPVPEYVHPVPIAIVQLAFHVHPQLKGSRSKIEKHSRLASHELKGDEI